MISKMNDSATVAIPQALAPAEHRVLTATAMLLIVWVVIATSSGAIVQFIGIQRPSKRSPNRYTAVTRSTHHETPAPALSGSEREHDADLNMYKAWYHGLHNLECHAACLSQAEGLLSAHLSDALSIEQHQGNDDSSILSIVNYDVAQLRLLLDKEQETVDILYMEYLEKRRQGAPRELFISRTAAVDWLRQRAPLRLVDGSWLSYIVNADRLISCNEVLRKAWQILYEEYGEGDLEKNHVKLYRKLLESVGINLPHAHEAHFIHADLALNDIRIWMAAVDQLLIGLLPNKFLPEILGFNMHFEQVSIDGLKAMKELSELNIDPYFFTLHVSIDNADCGHSALAYQMVADYMKHISDFDSQQSVSEQWRRVQSGYLLSKWAQSVHRFTASVREFQNTEQQLVEIFRRKARVSHHLHGGCKTKIGGRSISSWLAADTFSNPQVRGDFMEQLRKCKPWIYSGDSNRSLMIKELLWGGRMYGAFTQSEVELLRSWIDNEQLNDVLLCGSTSHSRLQAGKDTGNFVDLSSYLATSIENLKLPVDEQTVSLQESPDSTIPTSEPRDLKRLLSLWLIQARLLHQLVCVPSKSTNSFSCAILRVLNIQYGYTDEVQQVYEANGTYPGYPSKSLPALCHEIAKHHGLEEPQGWLQSMRLYSPTFASMLRHLFRAPFRNQELLIGVFLGCLELRKSLASHPCIPLHLRENVRDMTAAESIRIQPWIRERQETQASIDQRRQGFEMVRLEVIHCF